MGIAANTRWFTSRVSLRLKLTLWMIAISLVLQGALALVVVVYQRGTIEDFMRDRIRARAEAVSSRIRGHEFQVTDADLSRIAAEFLSFTAINRFVVTLYRPDGEVVASNLRPAVPASQLGVEQARLGTGAIIVRESVPHLSQVIPEVRSWRVALKPLRTDSGETYVLLVGSSDASYDQVVNLTIRIILITAILGVGAAAIASWMIAGLATAPLHELRRLAGSLSPEGIEQDMVISPSSLSSQELLALRRDLEDARSRLREALHAQDRFISSVSHELKTPIAVLLTEAQTIDARRLPEEPRKFIQSVTEEMRRLGRMVESFLTLTKVRGGMKLVSPENRPINDVVIDAVQSCGKMARQYGVALSPELADSDPPPVVNGDAELLRVMIDNLVHNAIRFSREGQRVIVRVATDEGSCEVGVRDFGPGVPEDMIEKVFERFVQAPAETGRGRGHGLGLSIAQGIAELHGGRISVRNVSEGGGCEFTAHLPLAPTPQPGPAPSLPG